MIGLGVIRWAAGKLGLALLWATLASTAACASADGPPMESDYPVAVMPVAMNFTNKIYWVDDHTVIFLAKIDDRALAAGDEVPTDLRREGFHIYTWNVDTGAVEIYASTPRGQRFCFDYETNQIWRVYDIAVTATDKVPLHMAGPLGQETPLPKDIEIARRVRFIHRTCEVKIDTPPRFTREMNRILLYPHHGYTRYPPGYNFSAGARQEQPKHKTMIFHRAEGGPVTIPVDNLGWKSTTWFPFKQAYFVVGEGQNSMIGKIERQRSPCHWAMWLWPDGRYEELCFPWTWWSEPVGKVHPTAIGFVASLFPPDRKKGEIWRWLYLISGSKATPIFTGGFGPGTTIKVSPNGCRLAFAFRYTKRISGKRQGMDLRVIDLCGTTGTE